MTKAHAERIRLAEVGEWVLPPTNRPIRKVTLAAPTATESPCSEERISDAIDAGPVWSPRDRPGEKNTSILAEEGTVNTDITQDSSDRSSEAPGGVGGGRFQHKRPRSSSGSENPEIKRHRHLREGSSNEEIVPVMERRLAQDTMYQQMTSTDQFDSDVETDSLPSDYNGKRGCTLSDTESMNDHTDSSDRNGMKGISLIKRAPRSTVYRRRGKNGSTIARKGAYERVQQIRTSDGTINIFVRT